jgi:hypothetical protein
MALSLETLKERWDHSLLCTDEAICRHSDAYKELKCLVCRINNETIDIKLAESNRLLQKIPPEFEDSQVVRCRDGEHRFYPDVISFPRWAWER